MIEGNRSFDQINNEDVKSTLQLYPQKIQEKLLVIRRIIFDLAIQYPELGSIKETLKWGEPSYLAKSGSTIRLGWKKSVPNKYGVYFNCKSKLIDTFKEIYPTTFVYDGNRAIAFDSEQNIPIVELSHCLLLALKYHKIKHLNLLGV